MKLSILTKILLVSSFLFVGSMAHALDLPMVKSQAALIAYGYDTARDVDGLIYSQSILNSNYVSASWPELKTESQIFDQIRSLRPTAQTIDTDSIVSAYVSVNSAAGDTLFYSYTEGKPQQVNGVWSLPASMAVMKLQLGYVVPIDMGKQVLSAYVAGKDSNGYMVYSSNFYTDQNKVYFPSQYAGLKNAYLVVYYSDGTYSATDIASGKEKSRTDIGLTFSPQNDKVMRFVGVSTAIVTVQSTAGTGFTPLMDITSIGTSTVRLDVMTTEGKRPRAFWLKAQTGGWIRVPSYDVNLTDGVTHVIPEFDPADLSEPLVAIQNDSGKG